MITNFPVPFRVEKAQHLGHQPGLFDLYYFTSESDAATFANAKGGYAIRTSPRLNASTPGIWRATIVHRPDSLPAATLAVGPL